MVVSFVYFAKRVEFRQERQGRIENGVYHHSSQVSVAEIAFKIYDE